MNSMKRFGLVALLVGGVTLLTSTPARADKDPWRPEDWGAIQLTNTREELQASGQASLTKVSVVSIFVSPAGDTDFRRWIDYSATLSVKCQNLTPGARYWTPAGTFTADRKGNGRATGNVVFLIVEHWDYVDGSFVVAWLEPYVVDVVRLNADGSATTVLTGNFAPLNSP